MPALPEYFQLSQDLTDQLERTGSRSVLRLAPTDPTLYLPTPDEDEDD